jgi:DNA adenine methylase
MNSKKLANKRAGFTIDYAIRLQQVQIECCDALRIIRSRDETEAFFYLDPPYVGTDQGHYDGYTQEDFDALLDILKKLKGKFLLSSYRNKSLTEFTQKNKWHTLEIAMALPVSKGKRKIEVLTANYSIQVPEERFKGSNSRIRRGIKAIKIPILDANLGA